MSVDFLLVLFPFLHLVQQECLRCKKKMLVTASKISPCQSLLNFYVSVLHHATSFSPNVTEVIGRACKRDMKLTSRVTEWTVSAVLSIKRFKF